MTPEMRAELERAAADMTAAGYPVSARALEEVLQPPLRDRPRITLGGRRYVLVPRHPGPGYAVCVDWQPEDPA